MLIPSIDLMGGKIVQLVQGEKKALEFDNFEPWVERFSKYPLVQLIDLDAAMRQGDNRKLVSQFAGRLPCQVGGGIHTLEAARQLLEAGAKAVILGSALIREGAVDEEFALKLAQELGREHLVFAVDSRGGKVSTHGWKRQTELTPAAMMRALEERCDAYLYTNIDTEGMMQGLPFDIIAELRAVTRRRLIAAGGITSNEEIARLHAIKVDAVVGMAIYTGRVKA